MRNAIAIAAAAFAAAASAAPIDIGSMLQVMWDDAVVDTNATTAARRLHAPVYAGVAMTHGEPWEGDATSWHNIVRDRDAKGTLYRMYYTGWSCINDYLKPEKRADPLNLQICYAESRDGLTWTKPNLGLCAFKGSKRNNIILDNSMFHEEWAGNLSVFKDENPACPPAERYKGITGREKNLNCFVSADGIHFKYGWHLIPRDGRRVMFDTQCNALWDARTKTYHLYLRGHRKVPADQRGKIFIDGEVRQVLHATSRDFRTWTPVTPLDYESPEGEVEDYPMYTNCVFPYPRNPDILVGLPTRYNDRGWWSDNYNYLPDKEDRLARKKKEQRLALAITDCLFMCSRDGQDFFRYDEAFMRPGPERTTGWVYGSCYPARCMIETPSAIGAADEYSIYVATGQWIDRPAILERYVIRQDGFASRHAAYRHQKVVTKELVFSGKEMLVNFATSARGMMRIFLHAKGLKEPLATCWMFGDQVDRPASFPKGQLAKWAGKPVTLEFVMSDADLYSFRFR